MSRNPIAGRLRAHKPKRIEDKRQDERKRQAEREAKCATGTSAT